jgi:hypothetical protein
MREPTHAAAEVVETPTEYFRQNFLMTFEDDRIGVMSRHEIGVNNLMWGNDFPHHDSIFPNSQAVLDDIFDGVPDGANLYFVHSYAARPRAGDAASVLAETDHGRWFVSAVARENVLGVQFHPERSGAAGLRIVGNFVRWASDLARDPGQPVQRDTRPPVALVPGGGVV